MLPFLSLLFGLFLAQRFKIFVLIPAIALVSLVTFAASAKQGIAFSGILTRTALEIAVLQIGYMAGSVLHSIINAPNLSSVHRSRTLEESIPSRRVVR